MFFITEFVLNDWIIFWLIVSGEDDEDASIHDHSIDVLGDFVDSEIDKSISCISVFPAAHDSSTGAIDVFILNEGIASSKYPSFRKHH